MNMAQYSLHGDLKVIPVPAVEVSLNPSVKVDYCCRPGFHWGICLVCARGVNSWHQKEEGEGLG